MSLPAFAVPATRLSIAPADNITLSLSISILLVVPGTPGKDLQVAG